ncbi:hypothetical protein [Aquiflexum sp.]|uniref:hypothetical protein n=1 Tax=Aquiflexum sp. TaxID=1872584 RepID=UPI003593355C
MGLSLEKNIDQLKAIINHLKQEELEEVKALLDRKSLEIDHKKKENEFLKSLLLNGPTLSKGELGKIKEARDLINKWRAE